MAPREEELKVAGFGAHGDNFAGGTAERGEGRRGALYLRRQGAALGKGDDTAIANERRRVFEEDAQFGDGAGRRHATPSTQRAAPSLLAAEGVDGDVGEREFGGDFAEESGALLERLDEVDFEPGFGDGDHEPGKSAARTDIAERPLGARGAHDPEHFEGFGVVTANRLGGWDGGNADTDSRRLEQGGVGLEKGQPAFGAGEIRKEGGERFPCDVP